MTTDRFAAKAGTYEQNPARVENVANIADAVLNVIPLQPSMHIIDFGSGTGLLLERLAPHVKKITAIDTSKAMHQQLAEKQPHLACELEMLELDLETTPLSMQVDGIVSSMTMHHIRDIPGMFATFYRLVKPGGFIAISDLDTEDGSFHTDDTGVYHHGFDREAFAQAARSAGFEQVKTHSASAVRKPHRDFSVFLLTATRAPN